MELKYQIDLTPKQLEELVREVVLTKFGIKDATITFDVGMEYEDRPCGVTYPTFKGAKVGGTLNAMNIGGLMYPPNPPPRQR